MDTDLLRETRALLLRDLTALRLTRPVNVTSPGAGIEFSSLVPGGRIWELLSVRCLFTTSAAVATRVPSIRIADQDGNQISRFGPGTTQAASLAQTFVWSVGIGVGNNNGPIMCPLPAIPPVLLAGWTLASSTGALDAADAFSGTVLMVREWSAWDVAMFSVYEDEQLAAEPVYP